MGKPRAARRPSSPHRPAPIHMAEVRGGDDDDVRATPQLPGACEMCVAGERGGRVLTTLHAVHGRWGVMRGGVWAQYTPCLSCVSLLWTLWCWEPGRGEARVPRPRRMRYHLCGVRGGSWVLVRWGVRFFDQHFAVVS